MNNNDKHFTPRNVSASNVRLRSMMAFVVFIAFGFGCWYAFKWIKNQPAAGGTPKPLRTALSVNENVFSDVFDTGKLVKEYPVSAADKKVRVNGNAGMGKIDTAHWRLKVVRAAGDTMEVSMDDLRQLPKKDIVFDFKCIEGWSQVTHWGGVPLKTFMQRYGLNDEAKLKYVGLETRDKGYYVGIDMPSALQSQTLLCYEMNGKPLPDNQGAPLRLIIPVKYGIKHLKQIGTMFFSNDKPKDYWAERGYDYYAGH
jgi:DMSO/TMAO reductase YedYZ molybdopterin-dependent catalytic subunit